MPRLPPEQRRLIFEALTDAFPDEGALEQMVFLYLGGNLGEYGGRGSRLSELVMRMIVVAESRNGVSRLLAAARAANQENPLLAAASTTLAPTAAPRSGFEVLVDAANPALDIAVLLSRLSRIEGQVCRVEVRGGMGPTPLGTGFLVGPDLVLTNHHVVDGFLDGRLDAASAQVRFDYKLLSDGVQLSPGRAVSLHAQGWLVDGSPPSALDIHPVAGREPGPDELDYALLRLAEPAGEQPRGPVAAPAGPPRGWLTAPAAPPVVPETPLWIVQHPDGQTMKVAFADRGLEGQNTSGTRLRHRVNTEPGSSGSPCFARDLALVAMHHFGEAYVHPRYNQAIPISAVRDRLHARGHTAALA